MQSCLVIAVLCITGYALKNSVNAAPGCGPQGCPPNGGANTVNSVLYVGTFDVTTGKSWCPSCDATLEALGKGILADGLSPKQIAEQLRGASLDVKEVDKKDLGKNGIPETLKPPTSEVMKALRDNLQKKLDKGVKCSLVPPGQSKVNGDMWGQSGVALVKDADEFPEFAQYNPAGPTLAENPFCRVDDSCAKDIDGIDVPVKRMSQLNWWYLKDNPPKRSLGVTSEDDYNSLTEKGKLHHDKLGGGGVTIGNKSNEKQLQEKLPEGFKPPYIPKSKSEHTKYALTFPGESKANPDTRNGYKPDNGSEMRMTPGAYPLRFTDSADNPSPTAAKKSTNDTKVTDDCKFLRATAEDLRNQGANNPGGWPNLQGGEGGGGGGPGGGGGGGLDKILPELMKALQGLGKGNQNPTTSPSPTPSAFACPPDAQAVCGADAITYANRCVAEYKNQIAIKHIGECTEADQTTATLDSNSKVATTLLQQLSTSGLPTQLITDIAQVVAKLIGSFLSGTSVLTETVVK